MELHGVAFVEARAPSDRPTPAQTPLYRPWIEPNQNTLHRPLASAYKSETLYANHHIAWRCVDNYFTIGLRWLFR